MILWSKLNRIAQSISMGFVVKKTLILLIALLSQGVVIQSSRGVGQEVIIAEFLARNVSGIQDEDGEFSDWIEIENTGVQAVNMAGWALTDDSAADEIWVFPAVIVGPGDRLLVFASGKDRRLEGGELHTDFRLNGEGEYLGLLDASGDIVSEFSPQYPPQAGDISFGLGIGGLGTELISLESSFRYQIPNQNESSDGWLAVNYDSSSWAIGNGGIGYARQLVESDLGGGLDPRIVEDVTQPGDAIVPTSFNSPNGEEASMIIDDSVGTKYLNFDKIGAGVTISPSRGRSVVTGLTLTSANDAPERDPIRFLLEGSFETIRNGIFSGSFETIATGAIPAFPGRFESVEVEFENTKVFASYRLTFPEVRNASRANSVQLAEVGFKGRVIEELPFPVFSERIDTDIETAMRNRSSRLWLRYEFELSNDQRIGDSLLMHTRFDDGFVAYLNGQEIGRRNVDADALVNGVANADRVDGLALESETLILEGAQKLLVQGRNVVSVLGLNHANDASGFYFDMRLELLESDQVTNRYFSRPSPGYENQGGVDGVLDPPQMLADKAFFRGVQQVALTHELAGVEIRYTLDQSIPGPESPIYVGPLEVGESTLVRARAFHEAFAPSPVVSHAVTALASDLQGFSSNLPIIVVDTFNRSSIGQSGLRPAFMRIIEPDEETGRSNFDQASTLDSRIGIKVRGSSTAGRPKASYGLEAWDEVDEDKNIRPLGMPAESDWILYGAYNFDRALMRNPFIYQLSNEIGRYAVRTRFVEVFVNTGGDALGSGDYRGVYSFMEKIKRDGDRVDISRLTDADADEPRVSGGYILKIDRADPGDSGFNAGGRSIRYVYPKEEVIETPVRDPQQRFIADYINDFNRALNGDDFGDPGRGYQAFIDRDAWIDHHLLNVLANNVDALRLSTYFHKDRSGKLAMGPIWDFDRSMDSADGRDDNPEAWKGTGDATDFFNYPWWRRLFEDPNFWQAYIDRWQALRLGAFSETNIHGIIDSMREELSEAQVRNFQRWSFSFRGGSWNGEVDHLKAWLSRRLRWIDSQFLGQPRSSRATGTRLAQAGTVSFSAPSKSTFLDTTVLAENAPARAIVPDRDLGDSWRLPGFQTNREWLSGRMGVGYEANAGYEPFIELNLAAPGNGQAPQPMRGVNQSVYILTEFDRPALELADSAEWVLRMRYDDGFVAFLNGVRLAQANAPGELNWNSGAVTIHNDGAATAFQEFNVTAAFQGLTLRDNNVLAIHGLNSGLNSSDFLIEPELVVRSEVAVEQSPMFFTLDGSDPRGAGGVISPLAQPYEGAIPLTRNTRIQIRSHLDEEWSGLQKLVYVVGEQTVRITEIMYHPLLSEGLRDAGFSESDLEYIELQNYGASEFYLSGLELTDGVDFVFPDVSIPSGGVFVVAANEAAFRAAYGDGEGEGLLIVGEFRGNLANGGERLELVDGAGDTIVEIEYDDEQGWPSAADGEGPSLEWDWRTSQANVANHWFATGERQGSPGVAALPALTGEAPSISRVEWKQDLRELWLDTDSVLTENIILEASDSLVNSKWTPIQGVWVSLPEGGFRMRVTVGMDVKRQFFRLKVQ